METDGCVLSGGGGVSNFDCLRKYLSCGEHREKKCQKDPCSSNNYFKYLVKKFKTLVEKYRLSGTAIMIMALGIEKQSSAYEIWTRVDNWNDNCLTSQYPENEISFLMSE